LGCDKGHPRREVYSNRGLSQETRSLNTQTNLTLKELEKEQQIKPKRSRREIITIRGEINEIENKRTVRQINETRS